MNNSWKIWPEVACCLFLAVIVLIGLFNVYRSIDVAFGHERDVIVNVEDKGIKRNGETDIYLVYTRTNDGKIEVFQITDSLLAGRFDSSDDYTGIKVGETYKFTVRGQRVRLFSWYPNIYDYKLIQYWESE